MKSFFNRGKRAVAILLSSVLITGSLSACEYSDVDEYLQDLGLMDDYDDSDEAATAVSEGPVIIPGFDTSGDKPVLKKDDSSAGTGSSGEKSSSEKETTPGKEKAPGKDDASSLISSEPSNAPKLPDLNDLETENEDSEQQTSSDSASYLRSSLSKKISAKTPEEIQKDREAVGLTEAGIENLKAQQKGLYAYELLTDAGKTLYVELLAIMQNHAEDVVVSTTSTENLDLVFEYVMADHPEIFYVFGYFYVNYREGDQVTRMSFSGNYTCDEEEVKRRQTLINEEVAKILQGAPSSDDDYYAVKYVYDYLITNTEYDMDAPDNQNICSVFLEGRSVCNGYAKAAQYLLNRLGIKCTQISGTVTTRTERNSNHAWNLVLCNNAYYYMDPTWGDSSYQTSNGETADSSKVPTINYDYFNVTGSEISRTHRVSDLIAMPQCTSLTDNYYVREGEYFTSSDLAPVGDLFSRRYQEDSDSVTIKCADKSIYDSFYQELITQRKVFDYTQGSTSELLYTAFPDTRTIIFWIK